MISFLAAVFIGADRVVYQAIRSRFMRANMVNDYISRNHFVVWKRTDERVRALQESWGGYMGSHMKFDMAGDAGVVKYAGMAAMSLKFVLLKIR